MIKYEFMLYNTKTNEYIYRTCGTRNVEHLLKVLSACGYSCIGYKPI